MQTDQAKLVNTEKFSTLCVQNFRLLSSRLDNNREEEDEITKLENIVSQTFDHSGSSSDFDYLLHIRKN